MSGGVSRSAGIAPWTRSVHGSGVSNVTRRRVERPYSYEGAPADERSVAEIVAALHAEIAAISPEHAALVAEYEEKQAAKRGEPQAGGRA